MLKIPVSHGHLEAIVKEPASPPRGAAVMCHPHPLHGGTMHTKAVYRAAQAFNEAGLVSLRFNFRGVGTSTGSHDEGIGEQDDLRAALDWLEAQYPHLPLIAGGFSFGSLVALLVGVVDDRVSGLLGLGLPVGLDDKYDYGFLAGVEKPLLVLQWGGRRVRLGRVDRRHAGPTRFPHFAGPTPECGPLLRREAGRAAGRDKGLLSVRPRSSCFGGGLMELSRRAHAAPTPVAQHYQEGGLNA